MRKLKNPIIKMKIIIPISILLFCFSCSNDSGHRKEKKLPTKRNKTEIQEPICAVTKKQNPESTDSIIIRTCIWGKYKFITTGSPDYKGRYSYEYEVYRIVDNKDIKVENNEIFNSKVHALEKMINIEIAKGLKEDRKYPDNAECLSEVGDPKFSINEMGISIDSKNRMKFSVTFGLGGACFNVDGASAKFSLKEIHDYLK